MGDALALERDLPLIATNPACFAEPDFYPAHDAMLCISDGEYVENDDRRKSSPHAWIKTWQQMSELFSDLPEALAKNAQDVRWFGLLGLMAKYNAAPHAHATVPEEKK